MHHTTGWTKKERLTRLLVQLVIAACWSPRQFEAVQISSSAPPIRVVKLVNASYITDVNGEAVHGCPGETIRLSCALPENNSTLSNHHNSCKCLEGGSMPYDDVFSVDLELLKNRSISWRKHCQASGYNPRCLAIDVRVTGTGSTKLSCTKLPEKIQHIINVATACGPIFKTPKNRTFVYTASELPKMTHSCEEYIEGTPIPSAIPMEYIWYSGVPESLVNPFYPRSIKLLHNNLTVTESMLKGSSDKLQFYCIAKNPVSNHTDVLRLTFVKRLPVTNDQASVIWIIIPAVLLLICLPLAYLAYLKVTGELDCPSCCRSDEKDDEVDYMITQMADSITEGDDWGLLQRTSIFCDTRKQTTNQVIKKAAKRLHAKRKPAHDVRSSTLSDEVSSNAITLPITDNPDKVSAAKYIRKKRAKYFIDMNISPMFKRPLRKIRRQHAKAYSCDAEADWIMQGIKKVEAWQIITDLTILSSHSNGSVEDIMACNHQSNYKLWEKSLRKNVARLLRSDLPCTKEEWLEKHRGNTEIEERKSTKAFEDKDVTELSKRLISTFRILKPHKPYFSNYSRVIDVFHSALSNPNHANHEIAKKLWEEYMDHMFSVATDVGTYNKLNRRVIELTYHTYGDPRKVKDRSGASHQHAKEGHKTDD